MLISRAVSSSGVVYVNTNTSNKSSNLRYSPKIHTWNYLNDLKGNQDTYLSILSSHWTPHPKHLHCVASARKKIWFPLHYVYQPPSFLPKKKKKQLILGTPRSNKTYQTWKLQVAPIFLRVLVTLIKSSRFTSFKRAIMIKKPIYMTFHNCLVNRDPLWLIINPYRKLGRISSPTRKNPKQPGLL